MKKLASLSLALLATAALPSVASAETITALRTDGVTLSQFDSAAPGTLAGDALAVSGLAQGTTLVAIDYRPSDGALFALGSDFFVYSIAGDGAATKLGAAPVGALAGDIGFDVNSVSGQIRIVTATGQNFRFNPAENTTTADADLEYGVLQGLVRDDDDISIVAAGYTRNVNGATILYGIDNGFNELVRIGGTPPGLNQVNPIPGTLLPTNPLGAVFVNDIGFDISTSSDTAYMVAATAGNSPRLYTVNLVTGGTTNVGEMFGGGLRDISVFVAPAPTDGGTDGGSSSGGSSSGDTDGGSSGGSSGASGGSSGASGGSSGASGGSSGASGGSSGASGGSSGASGTSGASGGSSGASGTSGANGTSSGTVGDGGPLGIEEALDGGGCGCSTSDSESPWGVGALIATVGMALARIRRRK